MARHIACACARAALTVLLYCMYGCPPLYDAGTTVL